MQYNLNTNELKTAAKTLHAGDRVLLSGTVYTSRDAAHKRIFEYISEGKNLPYDINGASIYYAGPTETPPGRSIGSCGPTTSSRMDSYAPKMYDMGLGSTIGKGQRSKEVVDSIIRNKSVYFCAIGGAGALASKCIEKCDVIDFQDLGCESVKKLEFKDFPLIVAIDCHGGNLFD